MSATLPGSRVHGVLASWLDRDTFTRLVEPTIADLQHEVSIAPTTSARLLAMLAGYGAIARMLFACELNATFVSARGAAILALGFSGAALEYWSRLCGMDGRVGASALLLPTFAAPALICLFERRRSFWQLFVMSAVAGLVTWVALDVFISILATTAPVWHVVRLVNGAAITLIASALAAAAMWNPIDERAPFPRQTLTGLCYASVATTVVFFAIRLATSVYSLPFAAMLAPFFVMLFAMILAVTSLPPVLLARRWTRRRAVLALVAMACVPAPIVASAVIDGQSISRAIATCLAWPGPSLRTVLPYVAGMATLGWLLGGRQAPVALDEIRR
jgi:hypothetical protein